MRVPLSEVRDAIHPVIEFLEGLAWLGSRYNGQGIIHAYLDHRIDDLWLEVQFLDAVGEGLACHEEVPILDFRVGTALLSDISH